MITRACQEASPHQFERVGYRIPTDTEGSTPWLAVLVCLQCGDELTVPVHSSRDMT